jgi:hypothetical protein
MMLNYLFCQNRVTFGDYILVLKKIVNLHDFIAIFKIKSSIKSQLIGMINRRFLRDIDDIGSHDQLILRGYCAKHTH